MNFWDHLELLRTVLLRCLFIIATATLIFFILHKPIFSILSSPLSNLSSPTLQANYQEIKRAKIENPHSFSITLSVPESFENVTFINGEYTTPSKITLFSNGSVTYDSLQPPFHLQTLGPLEGFSSALKLSLWLGTLGTAPIWLFQLFSFVAPGLFPNEKKWALLFIALVILFSLLGVLFAYFVTIPLANKFLFQFNSEVSINMWSLSHYIDYSLFLLLANALAGSCFVFTLFLVHFQILTYQTMQRKRRYVILSIFVVSALLTPPDVFTQCLLALPLLIGYESLILYSRWQLKYAHQKIALGNSNIE